MEGNHQIIDVAAGLKMLGGNAKIYLRLLGTYASGTLYEDLVAAVASDDIQKAQVAAHTMKGATGNLHMEALYELTKELEGRMKNGGPLPSEDEMAHLADLQKQTLELIAQYTADPSLLG